MQLRSWWHLLSTWVSPPVGDILTPAEIRRSYISRLLPGLMVVSFAFAYFFHTSPQHSHAGENLVWGLVFLCVFICCSVLCHVHQAVFAAIVFIFVLALYSIAASLPISLASTTFSTDTEVMFMATIFIAGMLLGLRACWIVAGMQIVGLTVGQLFNVHDVIAVIAHGARIDVITMMGTVMMAIGINKMHESLGLTIRTDELGMLNEELAASIATQQRSAAQIEIMRAVAHACASAADEQSVATAALREVMQGMGLTSGVLMVRDAVYQDHARLVTIAFDAAIPTDVQDVFLAPLQSPLIAADASSLLLQVLATGEPHFNDAPVLAWPFQGAEIFTAMHCIPLRFEGRVIGVLGLASCEPDPPDLASDECLLLTVVADEIATSLHRAYLYEEAHRLSLFDPLTNLYNHRAMQQIVQRELAATKVQDMPISLIMLDIDHFRKFNETYGHDMGDHALRTVARAIQAAIRKNDFAARYGGEEFVIVLPGADPVEAGEVAERIRMTIAQQHICAEEDEYDNGLVLTASLGYATSPLHASVATSLFKAADLALYAAKRGGRNTVIAYSPELLQGSMQSAAPLVAGRDSGEISLPSGADLDAVQALITAIDLRDGYTAVHSDNVARFSVAIGQQMGLPTEHIEALRLGGQIHDVGKIGVPDDVLRKPGKLTDAEWVSMRQHPIMGETIVRAVEPLRHLLPLVRWHHERLDGSGYPDGLRGDDIPLLVRILSVADIFEAYTAERPYHPARSAQEGIALLHASVTDGLLDATVVDAMTRALRAMGVTTLTDQQDWPQAA